ncbi:hypothetical protein [Haladaptatus cibarius]|uniref:hypothetical protein n=1 Tax=Haladaptatus cibarius TaxID=453847 RepID=UPI000679B2F9|nr:hypothetical protein [Haladaptatus cibarius]
MTVESVREASIQNVDSPSLEQSEEIEITFDFTTEPQRFSDLSLYPFPNQKIIHGSYQYESNPRFGSSEAAEGSFQIRCGSGLVILQTENDRPRPKRILTALDEAINSGFEIKEDFVPNQRKAWEFIEQAEEILNLQLFTSHGSVKQAGEMNSAWEEMKERNPIKSAYLEFERDTGETIQVEYQDDRLLIESDADEAREYILQIFESTVISSR